MDLKRNLLSLSGSNQTSHGSGYPLSTNHKNYTCGLSGDWDIGGPNQPTLSIVCIVPPSETLGVSTECIENIQSLFYKPIELVLVLQEDNPFQYACDALIQTGYTRTNIRMELCSEGTTIPSMVNIGLCSANGTYVTVQTIRMISHPLRFLYQTNPFSTGFNLKTNRDSDPVSVTVCKVPLSVSVSGPESGSGNVDDNLVLSPSTMCMKREVLLKMGLALDHSACDSIDMCMWEYLWRYVLFSDYELDKRLMGKYKRLSSNKSLSECSQAYILNQLVQNKIPSVECMDLSVFHNHPSQTDTYDKNDNGELSYLGTRSAHDDMCYTEVFSRDPDPNPVDNKKNEKDVFPIKPSYFEKAMSIMNYGSIRSKVTVIYVVTNKQEYASTFRSFQESFRLLKGGSVIVCVTPAISMRWIKDHPVFPTFPEFDPESDSTSTSTSTKDRYETNGNGWDVTYVNVSNATHAYSMVFSDGYLTTPYAFFLQDTYRFNPGRILYPLCYLLEFMDQSVGVWNSMRFSPVTEYECDKDDEYNVKIEPQHMGYTRNRGVPIHRTLTITDDPVLIRVRVASKFLHPYVTCVATGEEISVSKQLSEKYKTPFILEKLKMGVYERIGYPRCCVDLRLVCKS